MPLALVLCLLAGCGGSAQGEPEGTGGQPKAKEAAAPKKAAAEMPPEGPFGVTVTADGWENPGDLGVVVAQRRGFFEDEGINIWVGAPASPNRPVTYVNAGADMFGITQLPQLALAREEGVPVVAIGSLVSKPTTAMIWLKRSKIRSLADLKGKTIAIPGVRYQEPFLESALERVGLSLKDVHVKPVRYSLVPALLSGKADAIFGGSWNLEGVELERRGADPVITRMPSLGAPPYEELVVIVRRNLAIEYPKFVRKFMSAVSRGTSFALKHPKAALQAMEEADEADPKLGSKVTEAQVKATLPLLSRTNRVEPEAAADLLDWMHEKGMLEKPLEPSELLSNAYLSHP